MSIFQCEYCGCAENTALSLQGCKGSWVESTLDWTGMEDRRGKLLCSACAPAKNSDGTPSGLGEWHGQFDRQYLPLGQYRTGADGNLVKVGALPNIAVQ